MHMSMPFAEYIDLVQKLSNLPLTLNRLTLPFGIVSDSEESSTLLVGHILEDLCERFKARDPVDCLDVLTAAFDLGHDNAEPYLDLVPELMVRGQASIV